MSIPAPAPVKSKPKEAPAPLAEPKAPGGAAESTGGAIATTTTAGGAIKAGFDPMLVGAVVVAGIVITVGTVAYLRYRRSQTVLARAKG
jgi:hypothetical protein